MNKKMKHYESEISQFVDGELTIQEKQDLFTHLSGCESCRNTFDAFLGLKTGTRSFYEALPVNKPAIFTVPDMAPKHVNKNPSYRPYYYIAAAAIFVLAFVLVLDQFRIASAVENQQRLKYDLVKSADDINLLKLQIKQLGKGAYATGRKLPPPERLQKTMSRKSIQEPESRKNPDNKQVVHGNRYASLQIVSITKDDFLVPQLIGN